jgi:hypothetical protein
MWSLPYGERNGWGMALGWMKTINNKRVLYYHGGDNIGFHTHMAVYEDRDAGYGFMLNKELAPLNK